MDAARIQEQFQTMVTRARQSPYRVKRIALVGAVLLGVIVLGLRSCEDTRGREGFDRALSESNYVSAWLPYWDDGTGVDSLSDNADRFTELHPFWFRSTSPTTIETQGSQAFRDRVMKIAANAGLSMIPTVTTDIAASEFQAMLADDGRRNMHANLLCDLGKQDGFDGIDIDYENFAYGIAPADLTTMADRYAALVSSVRDCLKKADKRVHVTVPARSNDANYPIRSSFAVGVFDYGKLGRAADLIRPMAYDYVTTGSPPGSIDPIQWSTQVAKYAKERVADNKVVLGVPFYGQNWVGTKATPITAGQARRLADREKVQPRRDPVSGSMTFQYKSGADTRTVWYDDPESTRQRVAMARDQGLAGVSYWALGQEDLRYWD